MKQQADLAPVVADFFRYLYLDPKTSVGCRFFVYEAYAWIRAGIQASLPRVARQRISLRIYNECQVQGIYPCPVPHIDIGIVHSNLETQVSVGSLIDADVVGRRIHKDAADRSMELAVPQPP